LQRQRENSTPTKRNKKVATAVQHEDLITSDHNQSSIPSFTHEQYTMLLAMLNKHDLETSSHTSGESTVAAMLAGMVFRFLTSHLSCKWIVHGGATDYITPNLQLFSSYSSLSHFHYHA